MNFKLIAEFYRAGKFYIPIGYDEAFVLRRDVLIPETQFVGGQAGGLF